MEIFLFKPKTYNPFTGQFLRALTIINMRVFGLGFISLLVHGNLALSRFWGYVISIFAAKNLDFSRSLCIYAD